MKPTKPTVLCVDDEQNVVDSLRLNLRKHFNVLTALSAAEGMTVLGKEPDVAVVVSDMRMPEKDGATFLAEVKNVAPTAVRMLLTGFSDIEAAMRAVNEGQIFRFLTKPCTPEHLLATLTAGVEQHQLITAERVLLQKTLVGSVKAIIDILALSNPMALGRAMRIRDTVRKLAREMKIEQAWRIEFAALLSQLGSVTLPDETVRKLYDGEAIDDTERVRLIDNMGTTNKILGHIPRLEPVMELLEALQSHTAGHAEDAGERSAACGVLFAAIDMDTLEARGYTAEQALQTLGAKKATYGELTLTALRRLHEAPGAVRTTVVTIDKLADGMVLCEDLRTADGVVIVPRGFAIDRGAREHIAIFAEGLEKKPITVRVPGAAEATGSEPSDARAAVAAD